MLGYIAESVESDLRCRCHIDQYSKVRRRRIKKNGEKIALNNLPTPSKTHRPPSSISHFIMSWLLWTLFLFSIILGIHKLVEGTSKRSSCHADFFVLLPSLLNDPNTSSPANVEASNLYKDNRREYTKRVRETVEKSWDD